MKRFTSLALILALTITLIPSQTFAQTEATEETEVREISVEQETEDTGEIQSPSITSVEEEELREDEAKVEDG